MSSASGMGPLQPRAMSSQHPAPALSQALRGLPLKLGIQSLPLLQSEPSARGLAAGRHEPSRAWAGPPS